MRVAKVRIERFRGFEKASFFFASDVVLAGEPRAGRSDFVEALRRVLDPRSTRARINPLDIFRPVEASTGEFLTEVEVTLLDLVEQLEALLSDSLEAFDSATAEPAGMNGAGEAVLGVRLCYRIRYDLDSDSGDHWVDFPARSDPVANSFKRVSRLEREALPVQFIDGSPALQLRAEGALRTLLVAADSSALDEALSQLDQDVQSAAGDFARASVVTAVLGNVLHAGLDVLFGMEDPDAVEFAAEDGSLAALLRALQPALALNAAGPLPIRSHGSTIQSVFSVAEAIAAARDADSGVVVIADDFGDGLDASSSEYMAGLLHSTAGQSILTTRRSEVIRAFKPEELVRFVRTEKGRAQYRLPETTDKATRITRRLVLDQLLSALSARVVALVEGPLDVEGYGPLAARLFKKSGERKHSLAAHGIRLIAPPGTDGGITRLPAVAEIALQLGFRVRAVVDNDKPGQEDPAVARLAELCEQLVVLPDRTAVEAALIRGIPGEKLREVVESLGELGMPALPDDIDDDAIAEHLITKKILKKQGLGSAWVGMGRSLDPSAADSPSCRRGAVRRRPWAHRCPSAVMTWEAQNPEQAQVVATEAELTVVLGGAGVGKTTSALAAAAAHLERVQELKPYERVLFLSFSRASVARISSKTSAALGSYADRVDVMTFHSLAFSVVRRFGSLVGQGDAVLVSPAREKLGLAPNEIGYGGLIPLALEIARAAPAVATHLRSRWGLVIVDEFQDTGDAQQELLELIAPSSRMILLGDPNQCIYTFLAADGVRVERINEACASAGQENTILLPETSFRDPSGVIPAVANAVRTRAFGSPAVATAIENGRLIVRSGIELSDEASAVAQLVMELSAEGLGVAVFTHHNDMLASLSDALEAEGIEHEIAGLSDALASALDAQATMFRFRFGEATWDRVLESLAVFLTSAQRGSQVPVLATQVLNGTGPQTLRQRLDALRVRLTEAQSIDRVVGEATEAHDALGLPQKSGAWQQAGVLLSVMNARAARMGRDLSDMQIIASICAEARDASYAALTDSALNSQEVQLMNLYQTKGREADATVVVLREGDFMGYETEPFPNTSRLLYVVFSRARQRIIVLLVGSRWHAAVAPLASLAVQGVCSRLPGA